MVAFFMPIIDFSEAQPEIWEIFILSCQGHLMSFKSCATL